MHDHRPVDPPTPAWVRVRGTKRSPDMAHEALIDAWARDEWYGELVWVALVTTERRPEPWWTDQHNVRPRDED